MFTLINPVSFPSFIFFQTHCFQLLANVPGGPWLPVLPTSPFVPCGPLEPGSPSLPGFPVSPLSPRGRDQDFPVYLGFLARNSRHHNHKDRLVETAERTEMSRANNPSILIYLKNRFHVAVRLFSNRSKMKSKCGKNKKVVHEAITECVTDVLTAFWRPLWSIRDLKQPGRRAKGTPTGSVLTKPATSAHVSDVVHMAFRTTNMWICGSQVNVTIQSNLFRFCAHLTLFCTHVWKKRNLFTFCRRLGPWN